jgi:diguanylate cyclase
MVNELLTRNGTLSDVDINHIFETYISANRLTERIDDVGSQVMGEIEQVMAMIGAAAGSASSYTESLVDVTQKLGAAADEPAVRVIVESLVQATRVMEKNNQALEARLSASKQEITELQQNLEAVRSESLTDPLTTLANRKYFDDALIKAMADARAKGEPLSLVMTDIDHFKKFNDSYGHLTGDQVLRLVASSAKQNVKGQDIAARYGGEEFAIVLPETDANGAAIAAEKVRAACAGAPMPVSTGALEVTSSFGVAALSMEPQSLEAAAAAMMREADAALYTSKHAGRNRVTVAKADLLEKSRV